MLVPLAANLWHVTQPMRFPMGMRMTTRMTVVRLASGELVLHSPVRMDDALEAELRSLGEVKWVVSPNLYHHLFIRRALERFPSASLLAPPGLAEKVPDLPAAQQLLTEPVPELAEELPHLAILGAPKMNEVVFHHRPTGTLIASDLVFNVREPDGFMANVMLTLMGTAGRFTKSRMWKFLIADAQTHRASIDQMLTWKVSRVVMAHGDVLENDAQTNLERALS